MDIELYLPVKIEVYGWALELLEMYHFSNLEINVGLNDMDFDVNNPEYDF
jgi:outer membrane lipoprotein-sorting protein